MEYIKGTKPNKKRSYEWAYLIGYVLILHVLFLFLYKDTFKNSYNKKLFIYQFNWIKYILCILETVVIGYMTLKKVNCSRLTETAMLILNVLYFIPGVIQQAVTNTDSVYMMFFFAFWINMECWLILMKPQKEVPGGNWINSKVVIRDKKKYIFNVMHLALFGIVAVALYVGKSFSLTTFLETLKDVYGVRGEAAEQGVHWIILMVEYWASYFLIFLIAYFAEKKQWKVACLLLLAEICVFMIQGNRIILFLAFIAFAIGFFKIENKSLLFIFFAIAITMLGEILIKRTGGVITDIFRRYAIVPNRLSEQYFDYFLNHEPDFLRTQYTRIVKLFGLENPYEYPGIGTIIGKVYYGSTMNANTGLVGGGMFSFGLLSLIFTTFGYIWAFRLFEAACYGMRKTKMVVAMAVVLATLSINSPALLANIFDLTHIFLLYFCLVPFSGGKWQDQDIEEASDGMQTIEDPLY